MTSFPHGGSPDLNADGRIDFADLQILVGNWGKTVPVPVPAYPKGRPAERLLYVQLSAPQIGDSGPGWNSPPGLPWLNVPEHGLYRVWYGWIRQQLDGGYYTGVFIKGLAGVQDAFTAAHGSRNHGAVSAKLMQDAHKALLGDAERMVMDLQDDGCNVVLYYGGADKPISSSGSPVMAQNYADAGQQALIDAAAYANRLGVRMAWDAISWFPMRNHPTVVANVFESCNYKAMAEGPCEHPDSRTLANLMALCDEIGMCDDGKDGWLAASPHAQIMLDPRRRMWKSLNAPTCREYWNCNGAWSEASREDIENTAAKYGITLIDQMRTA